MGRALQLELYKPDGSNGEADPNMSRTHQTIRISLRGTCNKKVLIFERVLTADQIIRMTYEN